MSGSVGVQSDPVLSDVLSARSYLELAHGGFLSTHESTLTPEEPMEIEITSKSPLQPQFGVSLKMEKPKTPQPQVKDTRPSERPVRKRGRPRLDAVKDNAAIEVTISDLRKAYWN